MPSEVPIANFDLLDAITVGIPIVLFYELKNNDVTFLKIEKVILLIFLILGI